MDQLTTVHVVLSLVTDVHVKDTTSYTAKYLLNASINFKVKTQRCGVVRAEQEDQ